MTTEFADTAADILEAQGEPVAYQAGAEDPVLVSAVVTRHGLGPCPAGWPTDMFPHNARHAEFRLSPADVPQEPTAEDSIGVDGLTYEVRAVWREPKTGPEAMFWICLAASSQRGRY